MCICVFLYARVCVCVCACIHVCVFFLSRSWSSFISIPDGSPSFNPHHYDSLHFGIVPSTPLSHLFTPSIHFPRALLLPLFFTVLFHFLLLLMQYYTQTYIKLSDPRLLSPRSHLQIFSAFLSFFSHSPNNDIVSLSYSNSVWDSIWSSLIFQ